MANPILLRGARQLLTLRGPAGPRRSADLRNLGLIQDGAMLIGDGVILEAGPTRRLENLAIARKADEINLSGKVVLPGFVDSHTHLVGGPARVLDYEMQLAGATHEEIAEAGGGLLAISKAIQDTSAKGLVSQATRLLKDCLRQGTTTIEAKSGYGLDETGETKILRAHASLGHGPISVVSTFMSARSVPPAFAGGAEEYMEWLCRHMLPLVRRRNLAEFADLFYEENLFDETQARRYLDAARQLGFGLKLHAGQHWNIGGVALAVEAGAASVDHLVYATDHDAALLASSNTIATLLPGSVFYLGLQRYAPARALIDRGAAVALATNYNPETSPSHNMQMMMSLACRKMSMTPAEAISAATINGAHALRRAARIGSLEAGKDADLIVLSVPDYREIPYHFGVNLVEMTIRRGRLAYQASEVAWP